MEEWIQRKTEMMGLDVQEWSELDKGLVENIDREIETGG